jgi:hypothetical protein
MTDLSSPIQGLASIGKPHHPPESTRPSSRRVTGSTTFAQLCGGVGMSARVEKTIGGCACAARVRMPLKPAAAAPVVNDSGAPPTAHAISKQRVAGNRAMLRARELPVSRRKGGRGDWIRTSGLSVPNRALYQAEPRPERFSVTLKRWFSTTVLYESSQRRFYDGSLRRCFTTVHVAEPPEEPREEPKNPREEPSEEPPVKTLCEEPPAATGRLRNHPLPRTPSNRDATATLKCSLA